MISIRDILTPEEIEKYKEEWEKFRGRYKPNSEYNVHSGLVVISELYQFEDRPIFRAHVFNKRLRKKDPYNLSELYLIPFWHAEHYITTAEQLYHASMRRIRENQTLTVERNISLDLRRKIFWDNNLSVELLYSIAKRRKEFIIEDCYFTWYNDKNGRIVARGHARTLVTTRSFVRDIETLKEGDKEALERLIRKIEAQDINLKRLKKSRRNLRITKEELINALKRGYIPEEELYDFFSFWDKEPEPK